MLEACLKDTGANVGETPTGQIWDNVTKIINIMKRYNIM